MMQTTVYNSSFTPSVENILQILYERSDPELASVFVAQLPDGARIEMVESVQPPIPWTQKWVNIISVSRGCPVHCPFCDAGRERYKGPTTAEEMLAQIDFLVRRRFPDGVVPIPKWKIQFARMGDPALNRDVIRVIELVPERFHAFGFFPSISTIAPASCDVFFEELLQIKRRLQFGKRFQLQFSLHTTSFDVRRKLIPVRTWTFAEMGEYGRVWFEPGDRKITLNFALQAGVPFEPQKLLPYFSPELFLIKVTPVNPTASSLLYDIRSAFDPCQPESTAWIREACVQTGYECIISIGEFAENEIGSNCGMYIGQVS